MAILSCKVSDGTRTVEVFAPEMLDVDGTKIKSPWHVPPISKVFSGLVGQLAFTWADFENEFDLFLHGLVEATAYPDEWKLVKYKTRARIFRALIKSYFSSNQTIIRYAEKILGKAAQLQELCNNLAHGRLTCELEVKGSDLDHLFITTTLLVYLRRTNTRIRYTPDQIEGGYYEIAHLSGLMHRFSNPEKPPKPVSSPDKLVLLRFLANHHPRSKEPMLGRHPLSSEG
jgi:hypothetical protein